MPQAANVSVTAPVGQAIERVKRLLFRPFNLEKWFVIGFCAWLAHLGEAGYSFNYHYSPGGKGGDTREAFERAWKYVLANLDWIVPLAVALVLICVAMGVAMLWVSSRGKFMFLHCVALEKAEVGAPWNRFAREGNSVFVFRLVLGLIGMVPVLSLVVVAVAVAVKMYHRGAADVRSILILVVVGAVLVALSVVFFIIVKLTTDFVVPIMFLRGNRCVDGWRELLGLMADNAGQFAMYLLFQIVLALGTGLLVLAVVLVTCCIAGCFLMIPYVGTVLMLPVLMFKRSYSLYYLAQYGREYDVFPPIEVPPLAAA